MFADCDIEKIEDNGINFYLFVEKEKAYGHMKFENNFGKKITHK